MPFSPEEIEAKEFLTTLRGYDKDQVGEFLRAVAADYRRLQGRLARIANGDEAPSKTHRDEVVAAPAPEPAPAPAGDAYAALGGSVADILRVANEAAEQARKKAEEEADVVRTAALEESEALRTSAEEESRRVRAEAKADAEERLRNALSRIEAEREAAAQEIEATRRRATEESESLLASATETLEAARAEAAALLERAKRESDELVQEAVGRHDHLRALEGELRIRLDEAMKVLQGVHRTLEPAPKTAASADSAATPAKSGGRGGVADADELLKVDLTTGNGRAV